VSDPPSSWLGLPIGLAALLCYVPVCGLGPCFAVLVLLLARGRPWLRAHACQALALGAVTAVVAAGVWLGDFALETLGLPALGLGGVVVQLLALAGYLAGSLREMVRAYQRRDAALPWIGARARRWSGAA
jgi:uncharacterized membrane protein